MKTTNLPSGAQRNAESGHVWEEKLTNAAGSIEVLQYTTFRVRAVANTTVTVDGILAATVLAGEVMVFNSGDGVPSVSKQTVTVVFSAAVYCQVARMVERPRPSIA